jgi:hypothetical protein
MEREDYKSLQDFCSLVRQQKLRPPITKQLMGEVAFDSRVPFIELVLLSGS